LLENTINAAGGTVTLQSKMMKPGWIYTITNICAWVDGAALTQAALGYVSAERFWMMKKHSTDDPFETVDLHGEITLKEGDRIRVDFFNTIAADKLYVYINGYMRRM
jgi:hypothetical protein